MEQQPAVPQRPPGYPIDLERDLQDAQGVTVHVRPICPDDADALVAFHGRLSPETIHRRFFTAHPTLRPHEVERFTQVDYRDRLALVAVADGELVAVGRFDRLPDTEQAEVAFVVADRYQHHGIGTLLLEQLADAAWQRGIARFEAQTLGDNRAMLKVFFDSGFDVRSALEDGTVHVVFSIEPSEAYRAARRARHHGAATSEGPAGGATR